MFKGLFKWVAVLTVFLGILWKSYALGAASVHALWDLERAQSETANAQEIARLAEIQLESTREYLALSSHLRDNTKTIIKKVPVYVTKQDDANCPIPDGFVRLHDEATGNPSVPNTDTPGGTDGTSESIVLSEIGRTVVGNYGNCRETALRLERLQDWVKKIGARSP
jgi:hypothetical protein